MKLCIIKLLQFRFTMTSKPFDRTLALCEVFSFLPKFEAHRLQAVSRYIFDTIVPLLIHDSEVAYPKTFLLRRQRIDGASKFQAVTIEGRDRMVFTCLEVPDTLFDPHFQELQIEGLYLFKPWESQGTTLQAFNLFTRKVEDVCSWSITATCKTYDALSHSIISATPQGLFKCDLKGKQVISLDWDLPKRKTGSTLTIIMIKATSEGIFFWVNEKDNQGFTSSVLIQRTIEGKYNSLAFEGKKAPPKEVLTFRNETLLLMEQ